MKRLLGTVVALSMLALVIVSCTVSQKTLDDAEKRINALSTRGVPDSSLSIAKVLLYAAKDGRQRNNSELANSSADSMLTLLAKAEDNYTREMERLKPLITEMRGNFGKVRNELTGLHQARLDSVMKKMDSLTALNWLIPAEAEARHIDSLIPRLKFDEKRAEELRSRIPGTWVFTEKTTHDEDKTVNAVQNKIFTFYPDGKATFIENKKGKSSPTLKEDWEFRTSGKWDLLGDTVFVIADRFAQVRAIFEDYHKVDDKVFWQKKVEPTYDSAITDGSQNRYIAFEDLKLDFKKK